MLNNSESADISEISFPQRFTYSNDFESFRAVISPIALLCADNSLSDGLFASAEIELIELSSKYTFSSRVQSESAEISEISLLLK